MTTLLRRTRRTWAVAFAAAAALSACGTDSSTEPTVFGTYSVISVNGQPLPRTTQEGPLSFTEISGTVVLKSDFTYTATFVGSATIGGQTTPATDTSNGTFTLSGSTITFVEAGVIEAVGTISGDTMTVTSDGEIIVLKR
jgi:hypothetical protein